MGKIARILASFLFALGIIFISGSLQITGLVIADGARVAGSITGLVFIIGGAAILFASSRETSEKKGLAILISNEAVERSKKDNFIRGNIRKYVHEIEMIKADPSHRPQEIIGEFHVSPRGHVNLRVAWHFDRKNNILYIDDLLYEKKGGEYVDRWNRKASQGKIRRADYSRNGYGEFNWQI